MAVLFVVVVCARSAGAAGGWRRVPVPLARGVVAKVVAVSDSQVWVLGNPTMLWNGRGWHTTTDSTYAQLADAVAVPGGRVYGVASGGNAAAGPTLSWWDHGDVHSQSIADVGELRPMPVAVAASGPDDVWIAEQARSPEGALPDVAGEAYVAHWDGRRLTQMPVRDYSAQPGGSWRAPDDRVTGVVALSPSDVWVLGYSDWSAVGVARVWESFTAHWDGRSWHQEAAPLEDTSNVARPDKNSLVASGHRVYLLGETSGMGLSRWNGTRWSPVRAPKGYHPTSYGIGDGSGGLFLAGTVGHDSAYLHLHAGGTWSYAAVPEDPRAATNKAWANPVLTTFSRAPGSTRLWAGGRTGYTQVFPCAACSANGYSEDLGCDGCYDPATIDYDRPLLLEYAPAG